MSETNKTSWGQRMTNPVIKHALNQEKTGETANVVTYKSVFLKTAMFLLVFVIGVGLAFVLHAVTSKVAIEGMEFLRISYVEGVTYIACLILAIIASIVASLSSRLAGVFGTISCVCYGYTLGFMAVAIPEYQAPILLALVLTIAVVAGLVFLYRTNIVKVTNKFRTVVAVLFWSMIVGSLLMLALYFIPATHDAVQWVYGNPVLAILFAVFGVVIASLFLLCDFDSIQKAVEFGADKKYETMLAFGLAFSVVWLYFKILQLILQIMEHTKN